MKENCNGWGNKRQTAKLCACQDLYCFVISGKVVKLLYYYIHLGIFFNVCMHR